MNMIDSEALVIGGGPVGQVAALSLVERGVSVQVLDAGGERAVRGYACGLHPETLRIFDQLGLMPSVLEAAHRIDRLSVRTDDGHRLSAEFGALDGKYPYVLALRQFDLEEILRLALERRGVEVRRHHPVSQLYRRHDFVNVTGSIKGPPSPESSSGGSAPPPECFEYKANYVVGADGYFSVCRRVLGVELAKVRPTRAFAVCEFNADLRGWDREGCVAFTPDAVSAFWPLGPELGRFTIQVFRGLDETVNLEMLRASCSASGRRGSPPFRSSCAGAPSLPSSTPRQSALARAASGWPAMLRTPRLRSGFRA
jgi:2-polyprenyl-6-methoxyphenol hydroxylase-like FAD-dependent oxidoreductase